MRPSLSTPTHLSITDLSSLLGSISIACWVVVFTPQILENLRNRSADGLSVTFIIIWLAGDLFNVLGALFQGVLPTMLILAVYYTVADVVLLGQVWWYRGLVWRDEVQQDGKVKVKEDREGEGHGNRDGQTGDGAPDERTGLLASSTTASTPPQPSTPTKQKPLLLTLLLTLLLNALAILAVILAGILGWYFTRSSSPSHHQPHPHHNHNDASSPSPRPSAETLHFNIPGQIFGYICAALYLGSRVPQLLLNYRRKSTDGLSLLFFALAFLGNCFYVGSILAFEPVCAGSPDVVSPEMMLMPRRQRHDVCRDGEARQLYLRYFLINLSWFVGSFGTLWLDGFVFVQWMWYSKTDGDADGEDERGQ